MENKKINLIRIIITIFLFLLVIVFFDREYVDQNVIKILYLIPFFIIGFDILKKAFKGIIKGKVFSECFLMSLASIGAFFVGEFHEAVVVLLFYQIGELFEDYAIDKSEENITKLMDLKSEVAYIYEDNEIKSVDPKTLDIGSIIIVRNGDKVPIDGIVVEGLTELNTVALTGESIPRVVRINDEVLSGSINTMSTIKIKTTKRYEDSTASKIIDLVKNASEKKSSSERFISSFAEVYTPIVCLISILVFVLPVLLNLIVGKDSNISIWLYRALTILVISCPCALVVSIPLAFFSSVGRASSYGILIKGTNFLEKISNINSVVVDKTGTMTKGVFEIVAVHNEDNITKDDILMFSAYAENFSNHPIAKCIKSEYNKNIDIDRIKDCKEIGGYGLSAIIDGNEVLVGSYKLLEQNNIPCKKCSLSGTEVHLAVNKKYYGHIIISDIIKEKAKETINSLNDMNIRNIVMLTGDEEQVAKDVADKIGIKEYHSGLLPKDKLDYVENLYNENDKIKVLYIGDGINDAPVLVRADVGVSMGTIGSDAAVEASDVVIMDDNLTKIPLLFKISKKTLRVVYEIIFLSLFVKVGVLVCSIFGITNMWLAVFADVGMLIICVLKALMLLFKKYK